MSSDVYVVIFSAAGSKSQTWELFETVAALCKTTEDVFMKILFHPESIVESSISQKLTRIYLFTFAITYLSVLPLCI